MASKRLEAEQRGKRVPLSELQAKYAGMPAPRGFSAALEQERADGRLAVIAESKRRSPSRGLLDPEYDPAGRARLYEAAGATCMSVLTDGPLFGGSAADLAAVREASALPVLRKDFVCSPYQVHETKAMGADCMLLIAGAVADSELAELAARGLELDLDVLVEIHEECQIEAALSCRTGLVGVNNRDLRTFATDLAVTDRLVPQLAEAGCLAVSESAIGKPADAARAAAAGASAILVGEALMRAPDPACLLASLAVQQQRP